MWSLVWVLALALGARAGPALSPLEPAAADDLHSVGSYVREVRAAPPNYHHSYENEGDGEVGFLRRKSGGGKKGYQHFDSYHKKAGDNYEFEKEGSYGDEDDGEKGAYSHRSERRERPERQKRRSKDDDDVEQVEKDEGDHRYYEQLSELKQGEEDGNGGTEAYGHVAGDYELPARYTYPGDDEE